jgi:hypothetical protein
MKTAKLHYPHCWLAGIIVIQIRDDDMGRAFAARGRNKKYTRRFVKNPTGKTPFGKPKRA